MFPETVLVIFLYFNSLFWNWTVVLFTQELSPAELAERERGLRKLREELRNEEMKLVLLKKLRQSQQMKENIAVVPPSQQQSSKVPPPGKVLPPPQQTPPPPLMRSHPGSKQNSPNVIPPLLRGVSSFSSFCSVKKNCSPDHVSLWFSHYHFKGDFLYCIISLIM